MRVFIILGILVLIQCIHQVTSAVDEETKKYIEDRINEINYEEEIDKFLDDYDFLEKFEEIAGISVTTIVIILVVLIIVPNIVITVVILLLCYCCGCIGRRNSNQPLRDTPPIHREAPHFIAPAPEPRTYKEPPVENNQPRFPVKHEAKMRQNSSNFDDAELPFEPPRFIPSAKLAPQNNNFYSPSSSPDRQYQPQRPGFNNKSPSPQPPSWGGY